MKLESLEAIGRGLVEASSMISKKLSKVDLSKCIESQSPQALLKSYVSISKSHHSGLRNIQKVVEGKHVVMPNKNQGEAQSG